MTDASDRLRALLSNPFMGFAPWIVMSVIEGPGRFELAAALSFALALAIGIAGIAVGIGWKLLDVVGIAFFGVLILVGLVVSESGLDWLERWAGELSNIAIALVALCSIIARQPFTIQYARESVPREQWNSPLFLHVNYVITWVWTGAFLITALVGWIGDGPLHQPDNVWTNWIIQIALLIFALRFTEWYPDYATARAHPAASPPEPRAAGGEGRTGTAARGAGGQGRTGTASTVQSLFLPLAAYIVPVGIVLLIVGGTPWWIGVGLIVIGSVVTKNLNDADTTQAGPAAEPPPPVSGRRSSQR